MATNNEEYAIVKYHDNGQISMYERAFNTGVAVFDNIKDADAVADQLDVNYGKECTRVISLSGVHL